MTLFPFSLPLSLPSPFHLGPYLLPPDAGSPCTVENLNIYLTQPIQLATQLPGNRLVAESFFGYERASEPTATALRLRVNF